MRSGLVRKAAARHGRAIVDALVAAAKAGDAAAAGVLLAAIQRAGGDVAEAARG